MKILVVDTYYPDFVKAFDESHRTLGKCTYKEKWHTLMQECFGTSDFYSTNLLRLGHAATEVVANSWSLQTAWAREHGVFLPIKIKSKSLGPFRVPWPTKDWTYPILLAQVKDYKPDVIHFQDPCGTDAEFVKMVKPLVRLITAQVASPIPSSADFSGYDLMLSSFPHYVRRFREQGLQSEYFNLGFEPRILDRLASGERRDAVFVGGFTKAHMERIRFFNEVAHRQPFEWWGYGVDALPEDSPLRATYRGQAWAMAMYRRLYSARICLNHHIDAAENCANNMRLYEATGVGTLLMTDYKENLSSLFEPGKEVVVYHDAEECAEKMTYYLEQEGEREMIAKAGQARTLGNHTYFHRMQQYVDILHKHL